MRFIDIKKVIANIPNGVKTDLANKHQELDNGDVATKQSVIDNGNSTWRRAKIYLENAFNRKCWYTESKNAGCLNDVEHYRPKGRVLNNAGNTIHWYWFLAFDPENYRLSSQFSNRLNVNPETGFTGGKGDRFPLLNGQAHANSKADLVDENPVILDPCNEEDCNLLEFQKDGRPTLIESQKDNEIAKSRVEQSKLLLNLDFPTFNEEREILYNKINNLVERGDRYGIENPAIQDVKDDLKALMQPDSEYSKSAESYVRCFRNRVWVEDLLFEN